MQSCLVGGNMQDIEPYRLYFESVDANAQENVRCEGSIGICNASNGFGCYDKK
jgi:hypothetical protein